MTQSRDIQQVLRSVSYFADLSDFEIEDISRSLDIRSFPAGAQIFFQGQGVGTASLHIVVEGSVRVYRSSTRGREQVLRMFHAGDTFAEVPVFDGGPYPVSADAIDDSVLALLSRRTLLNLMRLHPEIALSVIQTLASRQRHFANLIEDLSLRRVVSRVAKLLLTESSDSLTQSQMAAMTGTSREMVNRSLHHLEDEGAIEIVDHQTRVNDPQLLSKIAEDG